MSAESAQGARIFLADDHPAILDGLRLLLSQEEHTVEGEAKSLKEALERLPDVSPDLVLMDLNFGGESGMRLLPELLARGLTTIVYTMHEDALTIRRAFDSGAMGYVTKAEVAEVLFEAIRRVLAGERFISPRAADSLKSAGVSLHAATQTQPLSEREQEILALLAKGDSNAEISDRLGVSIRTVESYYVRMQTKLGLNGTRALRKYALGCSTMG